MIAALLFAAVVVKATPRGVIVARPGVVSINGTDTHSVQTPTAIAASNDRAAVIDALSNEVILVDLATRKARSVRTGETPIDGVFVNGALYLLERDARALERIGADGARASISVAADPAFLREVNGRIYVYSRLDGVLQEITTSPFAIRRSARVAPFASDLEIDSRNAYLVYPRAANVGVVSLATMKSTGKIDVGAVPVDLAFASSGSALTAKTLAIADPSGKRVWLIEGAQSISQAITRGFLRGLLGLGLFGGRGSQFPTGVDRVMIRGSKWYAYDSSTGTLYAFTKKKSTVAATNVGPNAFSIGTDGVYVWDDVHRRVTTLR